MTSGQPQRAPGAPQTLVTPLRHVPEGWYLVFWRVISADGHPVRGAFTFAVGPNPGPPPQFRIPSLSETATTPQLLGARWVVLLSLLSAIGLFVLRSLIARPVARAVAGISLRPLALAQVVASLVALVATPIYVLFATAQFSLRSVFDLGAIVPVARASASAVTIWTSSWCWFCSPPRQQRRSGSIGRNAASGRGRTRGDPFGSRDGRRGARPARACGPRRPEVATRPGAAARLAPPRGRFDLARRVDRAGDLLALGQAADRVAALAVVVPRFSVVAFCSVMALIGSGIGASLLELPTLGSLWQTSYGKALLAKIVLLLGALMLAWSTSRERSRGYRACSRSALGRARCRRLSSAARAGRDHPRRRRALRRRRADQPPAARECARAREATRRPCRSRARSRRWSPRGRTGAGRGLAEPGRASEHVLGGADEGRQVGSRRRR